MPLPVDSQVGSQPPLHSPAVLAAPDAPAGGTSSGSCHGRSSCHIRQASRPLPAPPHTSAPQYPAPAVPAALCSVMLLLQLKLRCPPGSWQSRWMQRLGAAAGGRGRSGRSWGQPLLQAPRARRLRNVKGGCGGSLSSTSSAGLGPITF